MISGAAIAPVNTTSGRRTTNRCRGASGPRSTPYRSTADAQLAACPGDLSRPQRGYERACASAARSLDTTVRSGRPMSPSGRTDRGSSPPLGSRSVLAGGLGWSTSGVSSGLASMRRPWPRPLCPRPRRRPGGAARTGPRRRRVRLEMGWLQCREPRRLVVHVVYLVLPVRVVLQEALEPADG